MRKKILLIGAVVVFVLGALAAGGVSWVSTSVPWLYIGLAAGFASFIDL